MMTEPRLPCTATAQAEGNTPDVGLLYLNQVGAVRTNQPPYGFEVCVSPLARPPCPPPNSERSPLAGPSSKAGTGVTDDSESVPY